MLFISCVTNAQEKDKTLPKGNDAFAEKKYADAEADYRISQSKYPKKAVASYNLGNSIYRQKQVAEAKNQFAKAIKEAKTKTEKHRAFHNLGNCLFTEKEYGGAVEAIQLVGYSGRCHEVDSECSSRCRFTAAGNSHQSNRRRSGRKLGA